VNHNKKNESVLRQLNILFIKICERCGSQEKFKELLEDQVPDGLVTLMVHSKQSVVIHTRKLSGFVKQVPKWWNI